MDSTLSRVAGSTTQTAGKEEGIDEPGTDLSPKIPYRDLPKWRGHPTVGSDRGDDPESPFVGTDSSLHGSSTDGEEDDLPPLSDEVFAKTKDERLYRLRLQHEFHPSRTFLLIPV